MIFEGANDNNETNRRITCLQYIKEIAGTSCPFEGGEIKTETSSLRRKSHRESQGQASKQEKQQVQRS